MSNQKSAVRRRIFVFLSERDVSFSGALRKCDWREQSKFLAKIMRAPGKGAASGLYFLASIIVCATFAGTIS